MISVRANLPVRAIASLAANAEEVLARHVHAGLEDCLLRFDAKLKLQRMRGQGVQTRTGALRRSFSVAFADRLTALYLSSSRYFHTQEFGGVIRSSRPGGLLAVPLPAALTPAGVGRYPSPLRTSLAAAFARTFVAKTARGNLILFGVRALKASKQIIPLYVLRETVTVPASLGLRALWQQYRTEELPGRLAKYVERGLREAAGKGRRQA